MTNMIDAKSKGIPIIPKKRAGTQLSFSPFIASIILKSVSNTPSARGIAELKFFKNLTIRNYLSDSRFSSLDLSSSISDS